MEHFAELDNNNVVLRVVAVGDDCVPSDEHIDGETWCVNFFKGGTCKQTSYNNNFRKQYAGIGYTYDATKNKFICPKPYDSWLLDANDDWQAPITYPTITTYGSNDPLDKYNIFWDETNLQWKAKDYSDPQNNFNWDTSSLSWVSA